MKTTGCIRQCTSEKRLAQHMASQSCQANGRAYYMASATRTPDITTNDKTLRDIAIDHFFSRTEALILPSSIAREVASSSSSCAVRNTLFKFGFARRKTVKSPPLVLRLGVSLSFQREMFLKCGEFRVFIIKCRQQQRDQLQ